MQVDELLESEHDAPVAPVSTTSTSRSGLKRQDPELIKTARALSELERTGSYKNAPMCSLCSAVKNVKTCVLLPGFPKCLCCMAYTKGCHGPTEETHNRYPQWYDTTGFERWQELGRGTDHHVLHFPGMRTGPPSMAGAVVDERDAPNREEPTTPRRSRRITQAAPGPVAGPSSAAALFTDDEDNGEDAPASPLQHAMRRHGMVSRHGRRIDSPPEEDSVPTSREGSQPPPAGNILRIPRRPVQAGNPPEEHGELAPPGNDEPVQEVAPAQPRDDTPAQPRDDTPAQPRDDGPAQPLEDAPAQPPLHAPAQSPPHAPAQRRDVPNVVDMEVEHGSDIDIQPDQDVPMDIDINLVPGADQPRQAAPRRSPSPSPSPSAHSPPHNEGDDWVDPMDHLRPNQQAHVQALRDEARMLEERINALTAIIHFLQEEEGLALAVRFPNRNDLRWREALRIELGAMEIRRRSIRQLRDEAWALANRTMDDYYDANMERQ
ncbi:hypothetical protein OH77DRAFT_1514937 [Trametes cingulata]|nr:hypothetical protein OH77DRAFT_1514937 [Trametes cingulata]